MIHSDTDDETESDRIEIAPAGTLLGQLQRGRGAGFLSALTEDPTTVHAHLLHCITHDPRWDSQIESRAEYYARLIYATKMSIDPLDEYLRNTPDERLQYEVGLAVSTLGWLARLGVPQAVSILRDYVSYGVGWDPALNYLAELNDPQAVEGLADVICVRFATGAEVDDSSIYGVLRTYSALDALWQAWSRSHKSIARLIHEIHEQEDDRRRNRTPITNDLKQRLRKMSVKSLLEVVDTFNHHNVKKELLSRANQADEQTYGDAFSSDYPMAWYVAVECLRALNRAEPYYDQVLTRLIAYVEATDEDAMRGPRITSIRRILSQLPADDVLPVGRRWFDAAEWHKRFLGGQILEEHATLDDVIPVRSALDDCLRRATTRNYDIYRICTLLDILKRFPDIGLLSEVESAFVLVGYSFARMRAAQALQVNAPVQFADTYAYELLWDCQEECRLIGCEAVSQDVPGAQERLAALADDPLEIDLVREAARKRLGRN